MMANDIYERDLDRNPANYQPLSPLSLFERAARVHPDHPAVLYGGVSRTWGETHVRAVKLARALRASGVGEGDTVAVLAGNIPEMFEAHFGVPMAGAVLNTINTRLDAPVVAFILQHGEARVLFVDQVFGALAREALARMDGALPLVVDIVDPGGEGNVGVGDTNYEEFIERGGKIVLEPQPRDEWQAIGLGYTSGTTGNPKGVVTHHRGAFLGAVSNVLVWQMQRHPVYLWTLPMFHCNGWTFPWVLAAVAGTSVCLRNVNAPDIFAAISRHGVTHLCGAPIVMSTIANAPEALRGSVGHRVECMTAGAAPPAAVIQAIEEMGFGITHVYGLTETYGPATTCEEKPHWAGLPARERSELKARQGVRYPMLEGLMVANPDTLEPVPRDGKTIGEIFFRGNMVMSGYLKNPRATEEAFRGGWFHSGDLATWHPDDYVQIKDRSKDVIISGGENISSIEIENVLFRHPSIIDAAVVAMPHPKWGETPCAFVTVRDGESLGAADVIAWCRDNLAHFKCPTRVIFGAIAKTSTGKVQKYKLREQAVSSG
ncbi:MAG: acyl-CoA synthetase [Gammaproteobacteria bacterium]|nr:acyl-CoA synthetase [Gammaproteobacteria bacterium]